MLPICIGQCLMNVPSSAARQGKSTAVSLLLCCGRAHRQQCHWEGKMTWCLSRGTCSLLWDALHLSGAHKVSSAGDPGSHWQQMCSKLHDKFWCLSFSLFLLAARKHESLWGKKWNWLAKAQILQVSLTVTQGSLDVLALVKVVKHVQGKELQEGKKQ